jgi:hypothetical protein
MAFLEKADEFPRTMAIFDAGVNLAGEQVDPGEQAQRCHSADIHGHAPDEAFEHKVADVLYVYREVAVLRESEAV